MILVNGCSMTECYNLPDKSRAWPSLLSDGLNKPLVNLAFGGASNQRILRTTQEWLYTNKPPDFAIIGWTSHVRAELPIYNGQHIRLTPQTSLVDDQSLYSNPDPIEIQDFYYRKCYNEYLSVKHTLINMINLQMLFDYFKIPFLFFNAVTDNYFGSILSSSDDLLCRCAFEYYAHDPVQFPENLPAAHEKLYLLMRRLRPKNWLWWSDGTYLNRFATCAKDDTGHFLEEANHLLADEILTFYDTIR